MGLIKETLQKQINAAQVQTMNSMRGTIVKYYKEDNRADVRFSSPEGNGELLMEKVPVSNSLGSLTNNGVKMGQSCTITFVNSNPNAPLITGVNENNYYSKTCTDQGSFIADEYIRETVDNNTETVPMYSDWLDTNNSWDEKYQCIRDYTKTSLYNSIDKIQNETDRYTDTEVGLTHLDTKATLKMKDNGDIDIFVTDNVGIRISKKMRKIYFYGFDININGEMDILALLRKCRDCEFDGYRDDSEINDLKDLINQHIGYIEGDIEELKKCIAYTKEITGDIEYFSSLDSAIGRFETLKKNYNEGKYSDSKEDLEEAKNQIMTYYEYFEEELIAARERWGLV